MRCCIALLQTHFNECFKIFYKFTLTTTYVIITSLTNTIFEGGLHAKMSCF